MKLRFALVPLLACFAAEAKKPTPQVINDDGVWFMWTDGPVEKVVENMNSKSRFNTHLATKMDQIPDSPEMKSSRELFQEQIRGMRRVKYPHRIIQELLYPSPDQFDKIDPSGDLKGLK